MKQFKALAFFIILALILIASPHPALADQQSRSGEVAMSKGAAGSDLRGLHWHYQASAQVSQPGLIEAVLPAGVFFGTDNAVKTSQLDLTLVGPDGNPGPIGSGLAI